MKWLDREPPQKEKDAAREIKKRTFLEALVETGQRQEACKKAGIARNTPLKWARADEQFAQEWEEAKKAAAHHLEEEAHRRAVKGVEEPVFYKGEQVGTVTKYSDTLLIFLLKGLKPEMYREKYEVKQDNSQPQEVVHTHQLRDLSDEELRALEKVATKGKQSQKEKEGTAGRDYH